MESQLETLRSALLDSTPPYVAGTSSIPDDDFTLFYGKDETLGRIHLATASEADLQKLVEACQPATFGVNQQDILDEAYRKAMKLDSADFSSKIDIYGSGILDVVRSELLVGHDENEGIHAELCKLNVYGKDAFFKSHKDTPRGESMFGSLVIVFPTDHQGGSLFLRHGGEEWEIDSAKLVAEQPDPSVAYIAFYSDVEHEVALVKSGYRVTLTYNLYFASGVRARPHVATSPLEIAFTDSLRSALEDPEFLPDGGFLGFVLSHEYPRKGSGGTSGTRLKGVDAIVDKVCRTLLLKTFLRVACDADEGRLVILDRMPYVDGVVDTQITAYLEYAYGAQGAVSGGTESENEEDLEIWWVTDEPRPESDPSSRETPYVYYGNEASLEYLYGSFCIIVSVGDFKDRATGPKPSAVDHED